MTLSMQASVMLSQRGNLLSMELKVAMASSTSPVWLHPVKTAMKVTPSGFCSYHILKQFGNFNFKIILTLAYL